MGHGSEGGCDEPYPMLRADSFFANGAWKRLGSPFVSGPVKKRIEEIFPGVPQEVKK